MSKPPPYKSPKLLLSVVGEPGTGRGLLMDFIRQRLKEYKVKTVEHGEYLLLVEIKDIQNLRLNRKNLCNTPLS